MEVLVNKRGVCKLKCREDSVLIFKMAFELLKLSVAYADGVVHTFLSFLDLACLPWRDIGKFLTFGKPSSCFRQGARSLHSLPVCLFSGLESYFVLLLCICGSKSETQSRFSCFI